MELLKEMGQHGTHVPLATAQVHCRAFKDNSGALEMAKVHKCQPWTKHLNVKLHHFQSCIKSGVVAVCAIKSENQLADCLAKLLNVETLTALQQQVMGWECHANQITT